MLNQIYLVLLDSIVNVLKGNLPSCEDVIKMKDYHVVVYLVNNRKKEHLPECHIIQYTNRIDHVGFDLKYPGCPVGQYQFN